jgi:hypothetical protein
MFAQDLFAYRSANNKTFGHMSYHARSPVFLLFIQESQQKIMLVFFDIRQIDLIYEAIAKTLLL